MKELQVTVRLSIHEGKLDEFKEIAARCMASVREKDSGTVQYDWFFAQDHTECVVRETYRDSDAVLEHAANLGDTMADLLEVSDADIEFFGSPSVALLDSLAVFTPRVYTPFQSM